ncbi:hypothetical protein JCM8208_005414 [Rhodotorula glutinis]
MGVKDLGPLIKKRSPSSVTKYTSLAPFRGKRFAIDANLLTTKFHHAEAGKVAPGAPLTVRDPLPDHPTAGHRHARAWYWFLEALRKHGIHPIVVFDGDTRLAAKAPENERRRDARALQSARAAAEGGRGARLREMEAVMSRIGNDERPAVVEGFRDVVERAWGGGGRDGVPVPAVGTMAAGGSSAAAAAAFEQRWTSVKLEMLLAQLREKPPPSSASSTSIGTRPVVEPAEPPPLLSAVAAAAPQPDRAEPHRAIEEAPPAAVSRAADGESAAPAPPSPSIDPNPTTGDAPQPSPLADLVDVDVSPTERPSPALSPDLADSPPIPLEPPPSPSLAAALAASRLAQTAKLTTLVGPAASHGPIVAHVVALATMFAEFRADALNPVYSRNQVRVTEKEGRFFEALLGDGTSAEAAAEAAMDAASEGERALGEEEEKEEGPPASTPKDFKLDDIIAQSGNLFASHKKRSEGVPPRAFREVRRLVAALGVPYLEPSPFDPHEAEGVCAALCMLGHADLVVSEDLDVAVYGAPLLRSVTVTPAGTGKEAKKPMNVLDPERLRTDLGLTRAEFVDFALLCGTDFTDRVYKIGPASAHKLILAHSTIERALAAGDAGLKPALVLPENMDREAYLERIRTARIIFSTLPDLPLPSSPSSASLDTSSPAAPTSSTSTTLPSTFIGSLTPSPPSPILAALLRSYGIRRSRHLSSREPTSPATAPAPVLYDDLHVDLGLDDATQGHEVDELDDVESGSSALGLGLGLDEWARAQDALDAALVDGGDGLGQEWEAMGVEEDEGFEGEGEGGAGRGGDPAATARDEFERLYL